jgi:cell division protein DivIC
MKTRLFRLLKNKYFITLVAFAVWMLMFDQNKYDNQMRLQSSLIKLESQKAFFISEIEQNKKMSEALLSDTALMEKFAREKYLMKRPDEVVYVVVPVNN